MNKLATAAALVNRRTMKGLLVTAGILLAIALPAQAETWRYISESSDGDFFLDDDSIVRNGDIVYFQSLHVAPVPYKGVIATKMFRSLSCNEGLWRTRRVIDYNQRNQVVRDFNPGDKGRLLRVAVNSIGEDFYNELCR